MIGVVTADSGSIGDDGGSGGGAAGGGMVRGPQSAQSVPKAQTE